MEQTQLEALATEIQKKRQQVSEVLWGVGLCWLDGLDVLRSVFFVVGNLYNYLENIGRCYFC